MGANLLEALACTRRGWAVLPLWWVRADGRCACGGAHKNDERTIGKHPLARLVPNGVKDATHAEAKVTEWWTKYPDANVGAATGAPSGLDVVDIDGEEGRETVRAWEKAHGPLPETAEQITGGDGRHVLLAHRPGFGNYVGFAAGCDLRTTGGYIVVSPSNHRSGKKYEWDAAHHPDEVRAAEYPAWLVEVLTAYAARKDGAAAPPKDPPEQPPAVVERARRYLCQIDGAVSGQRGHNTTFRAACKVVRGFALNYEQGMTVLREWNARCSPPWSEKELAHKVTDALKATGPWGHLLNGKAEKRRKDVVAQDLAATFHRGDHAELSERLLDSLSPDRDDLVHDEGRLNVYGAKRGLWAPLETTTLRKFVKRFAGSPSAGSRGGILRIDLSAANGAATLACDTVHDRGFFSAAPKGITFADGFLAVEGPVLNLVPCVREQRSRWAYDFPYAAGAACPRLLAFLDETFAGDADKKMRIECVQEFMGISLLGLAPKYQHALVLVGSGSNGKSVLLAIIEGLPPEGSVASIAPQTWASEYRLAMLAGKLINIVNELPELELFDTEVVKCVISGDATTARPIREAPFRFHPMAGHVFSTNRLPRTSDSTDGFWRRFLVLTFRNVVPLDQQNPNLADEILASERPAIIAWSLEGAARLLERDHYSVPASSAQALEDWRRDADPVRQFAAESLGAVSEAGKGASASEVYGTYRTWAKENGVPAVAKNKFGSRMRAMGLVPQHTASGNRYPCVIGTGSGSLFDTPKDDDETARERDAIQHEGELGESS
jgi:putative DNA primase/helicase